MKINEAISIFKDYVTATKTLGTQNYYKFYFKRIQNYFENIEVENIGKQEITSFIMYIKRENPQIKNISINKHIVTLKTIIKYSTDRIIDFKKLQEQKQIIPILSDSVIDTIFGYYEKTSKKKYEFRNYLIFRLLLDTGLRINELLNLKVSDLDFFSRAIHVKFTKTSNDRYVFFTEKTKVLLLKYILEYPSTNYLFFDFKTNKPLITSSIESLVHRLKNHLKIKASISPHKWRHTFATNFINRGGNLESLRLILGHENLKTTQKYLHLTKKDLFDEYSKVMRHIDNPT